MSDSELLKKATTWLQSQGYPLEMRVARAFQATGWEVSQSICYVNDDEVAREIDVVAALSRWVDNILVTVQVVIECKRATDRPWVAFTTRRSQPEGSWEWPDRIASKAGSAFLEYMTRQPEIRALRYFQLSDRVAYAVTEAFHSGKDVPYGACLSVSSAAATFASRSGGLIRIFLPIIVIDGRLIDAFLAPDGELVTRFLPSVRLLLRHPSTGVWQTEISIVTESALGPFVSDVTDAANALLAADHPIRLFDQSRAEA